MGNTFERALTGFNNNFRHKGKVYHLQTEDSGEGHPHIITHVFVDGHIIATRKTSYEHLTEEADLKEHVRTMMREQHKAMALAIRDGMFDDDRPHAREVTEAPSKEEERRKQNLRSISGVYRTVHRREGKPPPPPTARSRRRSRATGIPRMSREGVPARARERRDTGAGEEPNDRAFGEELLTDKTLEEVIASYLSEDLSKG